MHKLCVSHVTIGVFPFSTNAFITKKQAFISQDVVSTVRTVILNMQTYTPHVHEDRR